MDDETAAAVAAAAIHVIIPLAAAQPLDRVRDRRRREIIEELRVLQEAEVNVRRQIDQIERNQRARGTGNAEQNAELLLELYQMQLTSLYGEQRNLLVELGHLVSHMGDFVPHREVEFAAANLVRREAVPPQFPQAPVDLNEEGYGERMRPEIRLQEHGRREGHPRQEVLPNLEEVEANPPMRAMEIEMINTQAVVRAVIDRIQEGVQLEHRRGELQEDMEDALAYMEADNHAQERARRANEREIAALQRRMRETRDMQALVRDGDVMLQNIQELQRHNLLELVEQRVRIEMHLPPDGEEERAALERLDQHRLEQERVATQARTDAWNAQRAVNEKPDTLALRYSRQCGVCFCPNPLVRAVMRSCSHTGICMTCAEEASGGLPNAKLNCIVCGTNTRFARLYEDLEKDMGSGVRIEETCKPTPDASRKRVYNDDDDEEERVTSSPKRAYHIQ